MSQKRAVITGLSKWGVTQTSHQTHTAMTAAWHWSLAVGVLRVWGDPPWKAAPWKNLCCWLQVTNDSSKTWEDAGLCGRPAFCPNHMNILRTDVSCTDFEEQHWQLQTIDKWPRGKWRQCSLRCAQILPQCASQALWVPFEGQQSKGGKMVKKELQ